MEKKRMDYLTACDLVQTALINNGAAIDSVRNEDATMTELGLTMESVSKAAGDIIDNTDLHVYQGVHSITQDAKTIRDMALNVMMLANKW